jgi:hypothetical protein
VLDPEGDERRQADDGAPTEVDRNLLPGVEGDEPAE